MIRPGGCRGGKINGGDSLAQVAFTGLPSSASPVDGLDTEWLAVDLGVDVPLGETGGFDSSLHAGLSGMFGQDYQSQAIQLLFKARF